ncbi:MAG: DUF2127 domain-containing protein [Acidimicrobiales bacterium]
MRLVPKDWHTETWVCSMRGHVAPASRVRTLRGQDRRLGVDLPDGDRLARCLRCDVWLDVPIPSAKAAAADVLPGLDDLPKPRRGKVLQDAVLLRLIAINKGVHAVAFGILAVVLGILLLKLPGLQSTARDLDHSITSTVAETGQQASRADISRWLHRVTGLHRSALTVLFVTAVLYCVIESIESIGLWRERRWAEYLTALATFGLLPFEIRELVERVTVFRISALVVNVAILVWLVWAKHLFGVRGGAKTLEEHTDWEAILASPSPAPHH